jgi:hypothetical protein
MISRPAVAQHGSSVSLTHTVTVTVPPRVKVQLAPLATAKQSAARTVSGQTIDGLALSINATQAWTLSIGSAVGRSQHQWSVDRDSGFTTVTPHNATVASGVLSATPATATVFFRAAAGGGSLPPESSSSGSDAVLLTVVAP